MTLRLHRFAELPIDAWRNGRGVTRTVAAAADWRLSLADIEADGPFSRFEGLDRTIVVVDGPGGELTVDGVVHPLLPLTPFRFSGDAAVSCTVGGLTRALNVMVRRGSASASVEIGPVRPDDARGHVDARDFLVVVEGFLQVRDRVLGPLDVVDVTGPTHTAVSGEALVARVGLRPA